MRNGIFIVSHSPDIQYLQYCLKSITKFTTGFCGVTLLVPQSQAADFYPLKKFNDFTFREYPRQSDSVKWQIEAQKQKLHADGWCDYDFVFHLDSDCIINQPLNPENYFRNGKPILPIERYEKLPPSVPWRACTEEALGMPCPFETMRSHMQVNPRGIYKDVRRRVELVQEMDFDRWVMETRKPTFPWTISEHNLIGSFALGTPKWSGEYAFVDLEKEPIPNMFVNQYWSHAGVNDVHSLPSGGRGRAMDDFHELGLA